MSARTFVLVHVTYASFSHLWKMGMHLYPLTYSKKAATCRRSVRQFGTVTLCNWMAGTTITQILLARVSLCCPGQPGWASRLQRVCLHQRSGQGDGLEGTAPFLEVRDKNSGYWNSLDGSPCRSPTAAALASEKRRLWWLLNNHVHGHKWGPGAKPKFRPRV